MTKGKDGGRTGTGAKSGANFVFAAVRPGRQSEGNSGEGMEEDGGGKAKAKKGRVAVTIKRKRAVRKPPLKFLLSIIQYI